MNKLIAWGAGVLGVIFIVIAAIYFTHTSGNLPSMMPGYIAGGTNVHYKHGIASLLLGLGLFALAWFQSGPKKTEPVSMGQ